MTKAEEQEALLPRTVGRSTFVRDMECEYSGRVPDPYRECTLTLVPETEPGSTRVLEGVVAEDSWGADSLASREWTRNRLALVDGWTVRHAPGQGGVLEAVSVDDASTWPLGDGARGTAGADYGGYVAADPAASVSRLVLCAVADPASASGDEYRPASAVASLDVTTGEVAQVARPALTRDPDRLDTTGWPTPDTTVIRVVDDPDSPAAGAVVQAGRTDTGEDTVVPLTDREPGWRLEDDTLLDFSDRYRAVVAAPGGVVLAHRASSTTSGSAPGTYLVGLR